MESSLSEVHNTSILRTALSTDYAVISTSLASRIVIGLSACGPPGGLERSDFVPWRIPSVPGTGQEGRLRVRERPSGIKCSVKPT
jgi:hypothetical protein